MISIGDMNLALDITKITGMKKFVEVINGRAAMIGITAVLVRENRHGARRRGAVVFAGGDFLRVVHLFIRDCQFGSAGGVE